MCITIEIHLPKLASLNIYRTVCKICFSLFNSFRSNTGQRCVNIVVGLSKSVHAFTYPKIKFKLFFRFTLSEFFRTILNRVSLVHVIRYIQDLLKRIQKFEIYLLYFVTHIIPNKQNVFMIIISFEYM